MSTPDLTNINNPAVEAPADFPELFNTNNQELIDAFAQLRADYAIISQNTFNNTDEIELLRQNLYTEVANITANNTIGSPEDGTYTDGLFQDFTETTRLGVAIDRINEALKSLSPVPPPVIEDIFVPNGVIGKVSFGVDNQILDYVYGDLNTNDTINNTGEWRGIIDKNSAISGRINPHVDSTEYYDQYAFANGTTGTLQITLNDVVLHTYDLSSNPAFSGNSRNGNGSGFDNITSAKSVTVNGNEYTAIKYRTAEWRIGKNDLTVKGVNKIRVDHIGSWGTVSSPEYYFVVDAVTLTTTFASPSIGNFVSNSSKFLSGVEYDSDCEIDYQITIGRIYRNTYSLDPIFIQGVNIEDTTQSIPGLILPSDTETKEVVVSKTLTVASSNYNRIVGGDISVRVLPSRTVQTEVYSNYANFSGVLVDDNTQTSTALIENFDDEVFRTIPISGSDIQNTNYDSNGGSDFTWDSTQGLQYNNGLLVCDGRLSYPTNTNGTGVTNGNFSAVLNGISGNPDYSGLTGNREYYRFFNFSPNSRIQDFIIIINSTNTVFVPTVTSLTGNNIWVELLVPNVTSVNNVLGYKDAFQDYIYDESAGLYFSGVKSGTAYENNSDARGYTLGEKDTSAGNDTIIMKITAPSTWLGTITRIEVVPVF
jgi:hypothetical protein